MNKSATEKLYTLKEACELLSISAATGRNWIKTGGLVPDFLDSKTKPWFEESTLLSLKEALTSGNNDRLKSRRNKTFISGNMSALDDNSLRFRLRHCAEQLILSAGYEDISLYQPLLNDLMDEARFLERNSLPLACCPDNYNYTPGEDTLGLLYQSLCTMGTRKASGSYYTPARLAKRLIDVHLPMLDETKTVLDPSCGTGVFLLQLPKNLPLQNIYGTDLNPVSVTLAQINLALSYHITASEEVEVLKRNIRTANFLYSGRLFAPSEQPISAILETHPASEAKITKQPLPPVPATYDIILGNPPWGARLSSADKKNYRKSFACAASATPESFDLFIEQGLNRLSPNGILSFVLPESILTVKAHTPVRKLLLHHTAVLSVEYLGEAFEQVHCPSIILTVTRDNNRPFFKDVPILLADGSIISTKVERTIHADFFSFSLSDEEYLLLDKIQTNPNCTTLAGKALFALGIVTGNNSALLSPVPAPGLEPIIRGSDISKYHINSVSGYIKFQPEQLQQTAPESMYRAPEKLFYRFINKKLIFAYDSTSLLSLNSCNILIPQIPGLSVKYVLAVLNSSVAQFVFEKKFHSVKVLRSHLEQLPIPLADKKAQKEIVNMVDTLMSLDESSPAYAKTYALLDRRIAELFGLTREEYGRICNC